MASERYMVGIPREVTLADRAMGDDALLLIVTGSRPKHRPYLAIRERGEDGRVLATVDSAVALRALAHRILRALGDAPTAPTKAKRTQPTRKTKRSAR